MHARTLLPIALLLMGTAPSRHAQQIEQIVPPRAKVVPKKLVIHGHERVDDYYWLNQREDEEVLSYLKAENDYTQAIMAHTKELRDTLFEEIKGRIKQTDESVPYKLWDYWYYTRHEDGKEYPIYCRKKGSLEADEEVMLDVNALAKGHEYCQAYPMEISPTQDVMAYAVDFQGRRKYDLYFKNLATGKELDDVIDDATPNLAWARDGRTVFYTRQDPQTLRWNRVFRHELGTDPAKDALVYEEPDEEFSCWVTETTSREFLVIGSSQTLQDERRYLPADEPEGDWTVFLPREEKHEYSVDHINGRWYVRTNLGGKAPNFQLMSCPEDAHAKKDWVEVLAHRDDTYLSGFTLFDDYLVASERTEGLTHLRIVPWEGEGEHDLDFGEPAYQASVGNNPEPNTRLLRFRYTSLTTPESTFDYDMKTHEKTLLKEQEVLGDFDKSNYVTERLHAKARDGMQIPISIVYRKGFEKNGKSPLLLYAYGSYGHTVDASFRSSRLSLIDRGFAFAIAHIRGGQVYGRHWYEDGKLLEKKNTFTDFIDAAEHLVAEKYTSSERLFAMGGSAGGLLMGVVVNLRPDLFHGVVAAVPFVDVVTTMLDDSIPLTTSEYDEWGNPNEQEYYEYMLSYSPYDNVEPKTYPHMLVTTGLHDSQVQYWEPAKWVAKLRAKKTDANRLLLKTNMDAGHGGASGRYKAYEETAFDYAFLLDLVGGAEN